MSIGVIATTADDESGYLLPPKMTQRWTGRQLRQLRSAMRRLLGRVGGAIPAVITTAHMADLKRRLVTAGVWVAEHGLVARKMLENKP